MNIDEPAPEVGVMARVSGARTLGGGGRRRRWLAGLALLVVVAGLGGLPGCGGGGDAELGDRPVDRLLIVSLPGVGWDDVRTGDLPHLQEFVQSAAIGDLSTRIGRTNASTTAAYLTIDSGTRAVAPAVDVAVALDPDESYGGVPSAEILERRLGWVPRGITYPAIGAALDANDRSPYGAEVGTLGDSLGDAGVDRAVIANADAAEGFVSDEPPPDGAYARGAATALMGSDGIVPGGTVGRSLLVADPHAPFGRRLDQDAVFDAFSREWGGDRQVTLVEASDLSRATAYGARATSAQRRALRAQALAESDALLGRLLERVDPDRDAVLVLSPVSPSSSPALGIAAVRAPGVPAGMLLSATTRRDGYVQLADVAPTVLSMMGIDPPDKIEGRTFQVDDTATAGRVARLAEAAEAADFRDGFITPVVTAIVTVLAALTLATSQRGRLGSRGRRVLAPVAYGVLGVVPATFLAGRIEAVRANALGQALVVVAIAAVVAAGAAIADRRRPGLGAIVGTGVIVGLIGLDVLLGAPLQVNTIFGYSVAVAGRFAGLGNLAFSLFGAATIVLAALIVDRAGRPGLRAAVALLAAVVVLEGLPMLGADVGGVLSMIPAFGVTALILSGRRVGWREGVGLGVATAAIVLAFAFIDAARPPESHTHLARLAEHLVDGRWGPFFDTLTRRWQASFGGAELAAWVTVSMVVLAAVLYAALVAAGRLGPRAAAVRRERHRPTTAAAAGLGVLALVGLLANDSSIAVPATMLIVVVPVVVLRTLAVGDGPAEVSA
jgi:hypothetical protein